MWLISPSVGAVLVVIAPLAGVLQEAEAHVLRKQRTAVHFVQSVSGDGEHVPAHPGYDHEAYAKRWTEEWEEGSFPDWRLTNRHAYRILRHMHPIVPGPQIFNRCIPEVFSSFDRALVAMVVGMGIVSGLCWTIAGRMMSLRRSAGQEVVAPVSHVRRPNLDCLDGLRTVLIAYIVLFHLRFMLPQQVSPYFMTGHWAVQFFFVLSGFVSFYSVEGQFAAFNRHRAAKFLVRRMVRLCPAYFAALVWVGILARLGLYPARPFLAWPLAAVFGQTLLPALVCGDFDPDWWSHNSLGFGANPLGWFVSCIIVCSVCFPALYNLRPWTGPRGTFFMLLLVLLARSASTIFVILLSPMPPSLFNPAYTFAPLRVLEFAAGALTAQLCSQLSLEAQGWSGWAWTFDASLALVFLAKAAVLSICPSGPPFGDYMVSGLFCLTCAAARGVSEHVRQCEEPECILNGGLVVRLLSLRPLVWLAEYSYGAFIYEEPVFRSLALLLGTAAGEHSWWIMASMTWAAGALSLHLLELPARQLFEKRLSGDQLLPAKT
mmetsp:Transcript_79861/g.151709  ORF Transcript_79861/g.151709 Transcript_79861/m.151709 type:complete len:545 (-) Transcript_79861:71-1705(-)